MASDWSSSTAIWVLAGCGLLLLVGICSLGGIGMWLAMEEGSSPEPASPLAPPPPSGPAPPTSPRAGGPGGDPIPGAGGRAPAAGPGEPPRVVVATITSVSGSRPVAEGAVCGFSVEQYERDTGGYDCRTQVVCAGALLYGGARAGYFPCSWHRAGRHIVGGEDQTTSQDGDAAFDLDTTADSMRIRDDRAGDHGAYTLEARVESVR